MFSEINLTYKPIKFYQKMETTASHMPGYFTSKSGNDALTEVGAGGILDANYRIAKAEADIKQMLGTEFCAVNKHIGDAECGILSKVGDSTCEILKNQSDIAHRNTIALNAVERDLQNRVLENRQIFTKELGDKTDRIMDRLSGFERSVDGQFRQVFDRMAADKLDSKNDRINELMHDKTTSHYAHQFALQNQHLDFISQKINSIEQTQQFTSKQVTFGNGNTTKSNQSSAQA